ncbi:hypothetical protein B30_12237 [Celeribacter baekdonensis B30]|uniref:Uncharacterized protein n=1 Tax=Celeribacter baekdonensis B30 TaxID=1208323 RepID=K2JJQ5_9RHOB|nr:hypothetical protein B30_12237 [Celeribacter baekdonensis B30]
MRFTLSGLKEHLDTAASLDSILNTLAIRASKAKDPKK